MFSVSVSWPLPTMTNPLPVMSIESLPLPAITEPAVHGDINVSLPGMLTNVPTSYLSESSR